MADEKQSERITIQEVDTRLSPILKEQAALGTRVKKLEDHPPGGPGAALTSEQLKKNLQDINDKLVLLDRRIDTIQKELPSIRGHLDSLAEQVSKLERGATQRAAPGN